MMITITTIAAIIIYVLFIFLPSTNHYLVLHYMSVLSINIIDYIENNKRMYDNVILYNDREIRR